MGLEPPEVQKMVDIWRKFLRHKDITKWVLFKYGTVVLCHESDKRPDKHAIEVLEKWGPVVPGTNLGDFSVGLAGDLPGWTVNYAHPDIGNYVAPEEVDEEPSAVAIGWIGREKRKADSTGCEIVHIESG